MTDIDPTDFSLGLWSEPKEQTIESLQQQLREANASLTECQAREKAALRHLQITSYHPNKDALFTLFENLDSTVLDTMLAAAELKGRREALLEAVDEIDECHNRHGKDKPTTANWGEGMLDSTDILRQMIKKLK